MCIQNDVIYAAVKANPDPHVLRLLAALGTGFDCASKNEINTVLGVGNVDPSRIIFANPCKATSFIRHAAHAQVDKMTFDNTDELYKIARTHPGAKLVVRILADDSKSLCRLGLKFGVPLVMVPGLLAKARELGLDVIGVSFHVGSGCYDSSAFADAIMRARAAFDMGREAGYEFDFLDVGGGFEDANFEETAAVLNTALGEHFPDRTNLKVIAEPGRFYVSRAFTLATNIIARRAKSPSDCARDDASSASEDPSVMCTSLTPISISGPPKNRRMLTDHTGLSRLHQRWSLWIFQLYHVRPSVTRALLPHDWQGTGGYATRGCGVWADADKQCVGADMRFDRLRVRCSQVTRWARGGRLAWVPQHGGIYGVRREPVQRV